MEPKNLKQIAQIVRKAIRLYTTSQRVEETSAPQIHVDKEQVKQLPRIEASLSIQGYKLEEVGDGWYEIHRQ